MTSPREIYACPYNKLFNSCNGDGNGKWTITEVGSKQNLFHFDFSSTCTIKYILGM